MLLTQRVKGIIGLDDKPAFLNYLISPTNCDFGACILQNNKCSEPTKKV